jgi:hypothetical protein
VVTEHNNVVDIIPTSQNAADYVDNIPTSQDDDYEFVYESTYPGVGTNHPGGAHGVDIDEEVHNLNIRIIYY